jgi:hypothetical protein
MLYQKFGVEWHVAYFHVEPASDVDHLLCPPFK